VTPRQRRERPRPPLPPGWSYTLGDAESRYAEVAHAATEIKAQLGRFGTHTINIMSNSMYSYRAEILGPDEARAAMAILAWFITAEEA
jgi:hypothetical protein